MVPQTWELRPGVVFAGDMAGHRATNLAVSCLLFMDAAAHFPHPHRSNLRSQVTLPFQPIFGNLLSRSGVLMLIYPIILQARGGGSR